MPQQRAAGIGYLLCIMLLILTSGCREASSAAAGMARAAHDNENAHVLQQGYQGYAGAADASITSRAPDTHDSQSEVLTVRGDRSSAALLRFDLSCLSPRAILVEATLRLYVTRASAEPLRLRMDRLLRPWHEADATWRQAASGELWGLPGAAHEGTDRASSSVEISLPDDATGWVALPMTALVQAWLDDPSMNHGIILYGDGSASAECAFASAESRQKALRPSLIIHLAQPTPQALRVPPGEHDADVSVPAATPSLPPTSPPLIAAYPTSVTLTLQQGTHGDAVAVDTVINAWAPDANLASAPSLELRPDGIKAALLRFDLSLVPPDSQIEAATLRLYVQELAETPLLLGAHAVLRPWDARQATWRGPFVRSEWALPGCSGAGADYVPVPAASVELARYGWVELDITALLADWVAHPELNQGLVLRVSGGAGALCRIASTDNEAPELRPELQVVYR